MKCTRCNGDVTETAKFCEHCGNALETENPSEEIKQEQDEEIQGPMPAPMPAERVIYNSRPGAREGGTSNNRPGASSSRPGAREGGTSDSRQSMGRPMNSSRQSYNRVGTNDNALIGFILSLVSVPISLFGIVPIISLIFSIKGLSEVNRTGEKGKGLAIAGIMISTVCIIAVSIILFIAVVGILAA